MSQPTFFSTWLYTKKTQKRSGLVVVNVGVEFNHISKALEVAPSAKKKKKKFIRNAMTIFFFFYNRLPRGTKVIKVSVFLKKLLSYERNCFKGDYTLLLTNFVLDIAFKQIH